MSKGEKQKRLSLKTVEKSALLFMAHNGLDKSSGVPEFIFFLEKVDEYGLPKMNEIVMEKLMKGNND